MIGTFLLLAGWAMGLTGIGIILFKIMTAEKAITSVYGG